MTRSQQQARDVLPVTVEDIHAARMRIAPFLERTPVRNYAELDAVMDRRVRVLVKHENHLPTNAFKVRNGLSALTALQTGERSRGVVCASTGNHGQGVAYAGALLNVPVTVVVPRRSNPEKIAAIRGYGARLVECGDYYDEAVAEADRLAKEHGATVIHSTNNRHVIAGAGTITLELLGQANDLDAMVVAVGGGSHAVGALAVLKAQKPGVRVYGVQAAGAPALHRSWTAKRYMGRVTPDTIADGVATSDVYDFTFSALCDGLAGFVTVTEDEIIDATRTMIRCTHNLTEPAGAVGLAGLRRLCGELEGAVVGVILSGGNVDQATLRRILE
jgi:threonine dehydratase